MSCRLVLLGVALVACSCSSQKPGEEAKQIRLPAEYDVYEAYVRDEIRWCKNTPSEKPHRLYFGIDGKDPNDEFLQRFRGQSISVKPASQRERDNPNFWSHYLSVETPIKWIDKNNAKLMIHTFNLDGEPEKCGTHFPKHYQRINDNKWSVAKP